MSTTNIFNSVALTLYGVVMHYTCGAASMLSPACASAVGSVLDECAVLKEHLKDEGRLLSDCINILNICRATDNRGNSDLTDTLQEFREAAQRTTDSLLRLEGHSRTGPGCPKVNLYELLSEERRTFNERMSRHLTSFRKVAESDHLEGAVASSVLRRAVSYSNSPSVLSDVACSPASCARAIS